MPDNVLSNFMKATWLESGGARMKIQDSQSSALGREKHL